MGANTFVDWMIALAKNPGHISGYRRVRAELKPSCAKSLDTESARRRLAGHASRANVQS